MKLLDTVALTEDVPEHSLKRGHVGTIVERLTAGVYEVEFCDLEGRTYALLPLEEQGLMVLHYAPEGADSE